MGDERRTSARYPVSLAGEMVTSSGTSSIAITRDVSAGGLLVFARRTVVIGEQVTLKLAFEGRTFVVIGTLMREEPMDPEASSLWRKKLAIAVDPADPMLVELYRALGSPHGPV